MFSCRPASHHRPRPLGPELVYRALPAALSPLLESQPWEPSSHPTSRYRVRKGGRKVKERDRIREGCREEKGEKDERRGV